ncbi:ATP-grasp peptide maturase system methyltransferase [Streptomyces sp. NPDC006173]|uniref:ATP-grasp peptide maturase system methyltransferase n=1 Tax=Streptomyces sp. NPDC006173 TaxID=3155349 RepID=UPI0034039E38
MSDQARLEQLVSTLTASGSLRTAPWKQAAAAVPRHEFLRDGFFRRVRGSATSWTPVLADDPRWLDACYEDESLVTQIAGTIVPADICGEIVREPTSSSTLPSLVLRMFEELQVEDGMRVLEIGTGTGYSTGVLCQRLGEDCVTSIEYDEDVAARARAALGRVGLYPALVTGDGLLGHGAQAPYDRVIATCGVRTVPQSLIEQTRPGGLILATVGGWLASSSLARLTVYDDGTASGPLLSGHVSFMLARPHWAPPLGRLPDLSVGKEREAILGADVLDDWAGRFVVQDAVPYAQRLTLQQDGRQEHVLVDVDTGSWAAVYDEGNRWTVRQGGSVALWDAAEEALGRWHAAGSPALEEFTLTVTRDGHTYTW